MFDDELIDGITGGLVSLDARVGELERKENPAISGIGPFEYEVHVDIGGGGDFTSIAAAAAHVLATSNGVDYWSIVVHGGDYTETAFTLPDNAALVGVGNATIFASSISGTYIALGDNCVMRDITLTLNMNPTATDCWAVECAGYLTLENCSINVARFGGSGSAFAIGVVKTETGDISNSWLRLRVQEDSYPGDRNIVRFDDANPAQRSYLRDCTLGFASDDPITEETSSTVYAETHLLWVIDCTIQKRSSGDAGYDIEAASGATVYTSGTLWVKSLGTVTNLDTAAGAIGTVTSVGMTAPSILSVSGSPITSAGTLALSLANQAANLVFVGPTSGAAAAPTFRALTTADGATGLAAYAEGDILYASAANTLARLAAAATGNVLLSGTVPSWGPVDLGAHVTGTLTAALHGDLGGGTLHDEATVAVAGFMSAADKTRLDGLVDTDGSGAATRLGVWTDANTLAGYASLKWDNTNEALLVGRAAALTNAYSAFLGDDCATLQLGHDDPVATSIKYGVVLFAHTQQVSHKVLGLMAWANREIVAAEKRAGLIEMRVGTTANSGYMAFGTMTAGVLAERVRITQGGALWVGRGTFGAAGSGLTGAGDLDMTGNFNADGTGTFGGAATAADFRNSLIKLFSSGAADITIQRLTNNTETTLRVMPKGTAASNPSALEFFGTDFTADGTNFERLLLTAKGSADASYWLRTNAGGTGSIHPLRISAGTNNGIWLATNGNIGINTLSPNAPLHVAGTALVADIQASNTNGNVFARFAYNGSGGNYGTLSIQAATLVLTAGDFGTGQIQITPYNGGAHSASLGLTIGPNGEAWFGRSSGLTGSGDVDINARCRADTFETAAGNQWKLGGYTATAPAATGYVSVDIDGTAYKFLVSNV